MKDSYKHALIIGAGLGLSASLARLFHANGIAVSLAARDTGKIADIATETNAQTFTCDSAKRSDLEAVFTVLDKTGAPDIVIYNPSLRVPGTLLDLDPEAVEYAVQVTSMGAFHTAQLAGKRMLPNKHGAILLTGATAGVKGFARSTAFAMGKFALRGLAQSLARELHPQGIHVGHFVIDGGIRAPHREGRMDAPDNPDSMLSPDAIAAEYWHLLGQDRSCWSWEVDVRPWVERF